MKTYAAYYDDKVRLDSSSGGLFSLISSKFEVIYGVEMGKDNLTAIYSRKIHDISSLRGSKYLQAKVGDTYKNVRRDLLEGKRVLFVGTACHVNGLQSFLQTEYSNLFTIDVICHGVPTQLYWQKFIEGKNVKFVNFRAKDGGWENYTYGMRLNNTYIPYNQNRFMSLYVKDYALRPSCYECVCKQSKKSDFTIGDFWGIEKIHPEMTDNKGTSVVFVRTEKGQQIFDSIKNKLRYKEVSYEEGVIQNPSEYKSSKKPENRDQFFKDMKVMTFDELFSKYVPKPSFTQKIVRKAKNVIKRLIIKPQ